MSVFRQTFSRNSSANQFLKLGYCSNLEFTFFSVPVFYYYCYVTKHSKTHNYFLISTVSGGRLSVNRGPAGRFWLRVLRWLPTVSELEKQGQEKMGFLTAWLLWGSGPLAGGFRVLAGVFQLPRESWPNLRNHPASSCFIPGLRTGHNPAHNQDWRGSCRSLGEHLGQDRILCHSLLIAGCRSKPSFGDRRLLMEWNCGHQHL